MPGFRACAGRALAGLALATFADGGATVLAQGDLPAVDGAREVRSHSKVRLHSEGSGRFEVVSLPGAEGVRLAEVAEAAWLEWTGPLALPPRLPVAITVRLVPKADWRFGGVATHVAADPAGVVSVWLLSDGPAGVAGERLWATALAEGVLLRKAFLLGLDPEKARAPRWLTAAAAEAVIVARQPSMMDAWQVEFGRLSTPAKLRDVLLWRADGGGVDPEKNGEAAFGVWLWLREESGKTGAWERFIAALLGGESPGAALAREFAGLTSKPGEAREWELAWRVAAARLMTGRTTPMLGAEESRRRLERLARIVARDARSGDERVMPPWGEWASRDESWPATLRAERLVILGADFTVIHPFYRNAAGSLGRAWSALAAGKEDAWREASVEWSQDMADGRALENASRSLLDASERPPSR